MMALVDIKDISKMLADQTDALVRELLPAAKKEGHEWRVGSCAGEAGRSMAIHSGGLRSGVWKDFSDNGRHGDALDLVAFVNFNGDKKRAVEWSRRWLGIDKLDHNELKRVRQTVKRKAAIADKEAIEQAAKRARVAKAIWLSASPELSCSPVEAYLAGRGIALGELSRPPGALRYAASLEYPKSFNDGKETKWPAMVAAICNAGGEHIATHRTYLWRSPVGVVKAPVKDAKLTLGSYRGGFISLSRGISGKAFKDAPEGDAVILCEGIEDGLSLALACPDHRVLAAIAVSNFKNIELPKTIRNITIAADNDAPDSPAGRALQGAIDLFMDQGRNVFVARSPSGHDFNDLLRAGSEPQQKRDAS